MIITKSSSTSSIDIHGSYFRQEKPGGAKIIPNPLLNNNNNNNPRTPVKRTQTTPSKMAGYIGAVDNKRKPRKLWSSQDRPLLNVELLKANLADEGDEECQLDMAKKLLAQAQNNDENDSSTQRENAQLAIYWLIKSGEQGNEEATALLLQCLKTGHGITCQNISDVRSCVSTPRNDKLVFKAARLLYEKLCNGEEFITTTQISRFILLSKSKHSNNMNSTFSSSPTRNNEDELNKTFVVDESDVEEDTELTKHEDCVKLTKRDLLQVASCYNNGEILQVAINSNTRQNEHFNWKLLSLSHAFLLQFLLLSVVTKALTVHSALLVLISLLTLWTAFHCFTWRNKLIVVNEWTTAFKSVLPINTLPPITIRMKLWSRWIQPLSLTNLGCLGLLCLLESPPALNFVLAAVTVGSIYRGFFYKKLTRPTKFLIVTTIFSSMSLDNCRKEIFLQFSPYIKDWLPSSDLLDTDFLQYYMEGWQTTFVYMNLVLIIFSRYQINKKTTLNPLYERIILLFHLVKMDGAILALTINQLYLVIGVTIIMLVVFYLLERNRDLWRIIVGTTFTLIFVVGSVISVVLISKSGNMTKNVNGNPPVQSVTWEDYNVNCHRKAWTYSTVPETQIKCSLLYAFTPTFVTSWKGRISNIKISHITKKQFAQFPSAKTFTTLDDDDEMIIIGGVTFEILVNIENPPDSDDGVGHSWQNLLTGSREKEQMNIVSISISTKGIIGSREKMKAVRRLLQFRVGDLVEFHGQLLNGFGGLKPEIGKISSLKCIDCAGIETEEEFSFTSESFTFDFLEPYEEYIGSNLVLYMREFEAFVFCQFERVSLCVQYIVNLLY